MILYYYEIIVLKLGITRDNKFFPNIRYSSAEYKDCVKVPFNATLNCAFLFVLFIIL
jgi:hypothetical protein